MNSPSALIVEDRAPEECSSTGFFSNRLLCTRCPFVISWPTQSQGRRGKIGPYRPACAAQHHRRYMCQPSQILGVARSPHLYGYPTKRMAYAMVLGRETAEAIRKLWQELHGSHSGWPDIQHAPAGACSQGSEHRRGLHRFGRQCQHQHSWCPSAPSLEVGLLSLRSCSCSLKAGPDVVGRLHQRGAL